MVKGAAAATAPRPSTLDWAMHFVPAEGISFCVTSGRTIFLDVPRDRYLCLSEDAEESFRRLASGARLKADDLGKLDELASMGLLVRSQDVRPIEPCSVAPPEGSLFGTPHAVDARAVAAAFWKIIRAEIGTHVVPLSSTLSRLRERRRLCDLELKPPRAALEEIAAALASCSLISSVLDKCLPRSIAAAHMMIDRSIYPQLIIGVSLQPFSAHCWVQHRGTLINDLPDRVRNYTPILVV